MRLDVRKKEWRDEGQLEGVQGREVEAQKGEEVDQDHAGDRGGRGTRGLTGPRPLGSSRLWAGVAG